MHTLGRHSQRLRAQEVSRSAEEVYTGWSKKSDTPVLILR